MLVLAIWRWEDFLNVSLPVQIAQRELCTLKGLLAVVSFLLLLPSLLFPSGNLGNRAPGK